MSIADWLPYPPPLYINIGFELSHAPKSLKSLLEKVSEKSPDSRPEFFDPVSFELKYIY